MKHNIVSLFQDHRSSSAPMKRIALLGVLLVLFVSGCAQKPPEGYYPYPESLYELYKTLIVQIKTEFTKDKSENGFGFIVGEDEIGKQFYVVTANHVVRLFDNKGNPVQEDNHDKKISVRLSWDIGASRDATLLDKQSIKKELDIALLRIDKKVADKVSWTSLNWCRDWQKKIPVWFIGWRGEMELPPEPGQLLERIPSPSRINVWMRTIRRGNSGTPLIVEGGGIVGMVVADESINDIVTAVDIEHIYNFVHAQNSYPWKLNKGNCTGSGSGHIKIIHHKSNEDAAQRIVTALQKAGFTEEPFPYPQWVKTMRDNFALSGENIPDYGGYKLFYSENQKPLADQVKHIVNQLPGEEKLEIRLVDNRILKALGAESNGMLMVLNNN